MKTLKGGRNQAIKPGRLVTLVAVKWQCQPRKLRLIVSLTGLVALMLVLSGCTYPGQDAPCVGANRNAPGCVNPSQNITDDPNGGAWYDNWAFDILKRLMSSIAINAVKLGVSIFWNIFTSIASVDFASCNAASANTPTCITVGTFQNIQTIAFLFFPLILSYKFFKSYFIGAFIEQVHESALSFVPKAFIAGFVIAFLAVIISAAFGLSNLIFVSIIGSPQDLNALSGGLVGSQVCTDHHNGTPVVCVVSGVQSIQSLQNIGLVLIDMLVCLLVSIVYIILGLCFFLRTILIFILFCLSPLAVIAGTTEEFRHWFGKWMESIQMLLVAPIPVAVCLALVKDFVTQLPPANGDPAGFILTLVYVISFLAIGAVLMFKIAGSTGSFMFGVAVASVGSVGGYAAGKLAGGSGRTAMSQAEQDEPPTQASGAGNRATGQLPAFQSNNSNSGNFNQRSAAAAESASGAGAGAQQVQTEMVQTLRSMNANNSAAMMASATTATANTYSSLTSSGGGGGAGAGPGGSNFGHRTHDNIQSIGQWAGREAGFRSPGISFAPERGGAEGTGPVVTHSESGQSYTYSSFDLSVNPPNGGGGGANPPQANEARRSDPGDQPSGGTGAAEMWAIENYGDTAIPTQNNLPPQRVMPLLPAPASILTSSHNNNSDADRNNGQYVTVAPKTAIGPNPITNVYGNHQPNVPSIASMTGQAAA